MGIVPEIILKVLGSLLAIAGLVVIYAAPKIVAKRKLDEKKTIDPERVAGLDEEELKKYKTDSAILDVKIKGLLIALPGFVIILIMFRNV
ncbi:MAG: hypothetical protein ACYCYI_08385 [Saccharofermentanales bacterium]